MPADALRPEDPDDYVDSVFGGLPAGITQDFHPPRIGYNAWKLLHFSTAQASDPEFSGMDIDPDLDGLTNFAEYAHGTHPLAPDAENVLEYYVTPFGYDGIAFKAGPAAADAVFRLESSADFINWQTAISYRYHDFMNYSYVLSPDGTQVRVTFQASRGVPEPPRKFWRLRIASE